MTTPYIPPVTGGLLDRALVSAPDTVIVTVQVFIGDQVLQLLAPVGSAGAAALAVGEAGPAVGEVTA